MTVETRRLKGTVESGTALVGAQPLRAAAIAAVERYAPMGQRHWLQILPPGIDPSAPQDPARLPWPITVNWDLGTGLPEADAAALARFVHDAAGQSAAPASSPAPLKPVKDWAISEITSERSGFVVELREPGAMHSQFVFVRRSGPAWQFVWVE